MGYSDLIWGHEIGGADCGYRCCVTVNIHLCSTTFTSYSEKHAIGALQLTSFHLQWNALSLSPVLWYDLIYFSVASFCFVKLCSLHMLVGPSVMYSPQLIVHVLTHLCCLCTSLCSWKSIYPTPKQHRHDTDTTKIAPTKILLSETTLVWHRYWHRHQHETWFWCM